MEELNIYNVQNEILTVGCVYKNSNLYVEHGKIIKSQYDFYDEVTRFYYDNFEVMYKTFTQTITENSINTFMSQDMERLKTYRKYGGYKTLKKWMDLANTDDMRNYLEIVKKYSLLREYNTRGYNVVKIMNHPKFELFKANDIYKIIRAGADKVSTTIMAENESVVVSKGNQELVKKMLIKPQMGLEIPFPLLNEMFRGFRLGKIMALGFLSNEGKTRLATLMACFIAFCKGEKVYLMANETDEEDIRACILTTVINNDYFKEMHGIDVSKQEREIVLGLYRDDEGNLIQRKFDDFGDFEETEEEYIDRVHKTSRAYRNVLKVAEWIDNQENKTIFFQRFTDYSDENLEFEIRKMHIAHGVKYFIYDTLKGYKDDSWTIIKQTTTMLSDIASELKICLWADIQLTDDSVYTDIFGFSSNNIANAKQLKHVLDHLILGKRLSKEEYCKYKIVLSDNEWGLKEKELDLGKTYYCLKVDKNRSGSKDRIPVLEVDLDLNVWKELGYLIKNK